MHGPQKQKGMTAIGWLMVLALGGLIAIVLMKLIPVYIQGYQIYDALESMAADPGLRGKSVGEIKKNFKRRLDINSVYDVTDDDITISRGNNRSYVVELDYEPRKALFGNLYVVVVFQKTVEIPSN